jgi:AraC-like DNA-binding protein
MNDADLPLAAFERFRTADLNDARRQAEGLLSPHKLEPTRRGASLDVRYRVVDLVDTSIICARYGAAVRLDPGALENFYLVGMPLAGASSVWCDGVEVVSHAGLASVQSCRQRVVADWDDDCCKLSVKIDRSALERCLADLLGRPLRKPVVFERALDLEHGPGTSWRRLVAFLIAELSPSSIYLSTTAARRSLDNTLMSALLFAQPHTYTAELRAKPDGTAPRYVRKAEELLADDPSCVHRISDLAGQLGVSTRSLQAGFMKYRGTTLQEFIREQRLLKARRALMDATSSTRITDVALDAGYTHLGRFAGEYKARYGELPSITLRRCAGG